jgi:hypothetical protein
MLWIFGASQYFISPPKEKIKRTEPEMVHLVPWATTKDGPTLIDGKK